MVEELPTGLYDIYCNGRVVLYDRDDLDEVRNELRRRGVRSFTLVEEDGYRTPMSA